MSQSKRPPIDILEESALALKDELESLIAANSNAAYFAKAVRRAGDALKSLSVVLKTLGEPFDWIAGYIEDIGRVLVSATPGRLRNEDIAKTAASALHSALQIMEKYAADHLSWVRNRESQDMAVALFARDFSATGTVISRLFAMAKGLEETDHNTVGDAANRLHSALDSAMKKEKAG